eukprot:22807_1
MSLVLFILIIQIKHYFGEILINPSAGTYHCGLTEDCHIICNETSSCSCGTGSTQYCRIFYVYNHSITIECTANYACQGATITAINTQLLNISFQGQEAFQEGEVFFDSTNKQISVLCHYYNACTRGTFHYNGQEPATHICAPNACNSILIHSMSAISLHCDNTIPSVAGCVNVAILWPTNATKMNTSSIAFFPGGYARDPYQYDGARIYIYLSNTIIAPNIIGPGDDRYLESVYIIYGNKFDNILTANNINDITNFNPINNIIIDIYDNSDHSTGLDF